MKNKNSNFSLLSKKTVLKRAFIVSFSAIVLLFSTIITVNAIRNLNVSADEATSSVVKIYRGGEYYYGKWSTFNYTVKDISKGVDEGKSFQAYCGQASKSSPKQNETFQSYALSYGTYKDVCDEFGENCIKVLQPTTNQSEINNRAIALLIFMYQSENPIHKNWINSYFGGFKGSRYGYVHALISILYANDATGVGNQLSQLNAIADALKAAVTAEPDDEGGSSGVDAPVTNEDVAIEAWKIAQTLTLYHTRGTNNRQDVLYLNMPSGGFGKITVQKCDSELNVVVKDDSEAPGVDDGTSEDDSEGQRPSEEYPDDTEDGDGQGVEPGEQELGTVCEPYDRRSLEGIVFGLYRLDYTAGSTTPTEVFIKEESTKSNGRVVFEVPVGIYRVKELRSNNVYALTAEDKTLTVSYSGDNAKGIFYDRPIRGDVKFVKRDSTNNRVMQNTLFSISYLKKDNTIGETHFVVSDQNGVVDTSSSFVSHTSNTNGYDPLYELGKPITFAGHGSWFGLNLEGKQVPVKNELGALPYGVYIIQEMQCDRNMVCFNIKDQKKTVTIDQDNVTVDLGDWDNTCAELELGTTATDKADGDKFVKADEHAVIKDVVRYCARVGLSYTIKGTLVEKETGNPILDSNGQPIANSVALSEITERCGVVEMEFALDASELGGKSVVVIEELYYNNELIMDHSDLSDENQTVNIVSLHTTATDNADEDKFIEEGTRAEIKDVVKYCTRVGLSYTIEGMLVERESGNPILENGQPITNSVTLNNITEPCGEVEMTFSLDTSNLGGKGVVVVEKLFYDNKQIVEHFDLNDENQTVDVISLYTYAVNNETGEKSLPANSDVVIKDTVTYCLKPGLEYTFKGVLMNKNSQTEVLVDGEPVRTELVFMPNETCGEFEVFFKLNTTDLTGEELVIFEDLYYDDKIILEHRDFDNESETVTVDFPVPETGYISGTKSGVSKSNGIIYIAGGLAIIIVAGFIIHKRRTRVDFAKH